MILRRRIGRQKGDIYESYCMKLVCFLTVFAAFWSSEARELNAIVGVGWGEIQSIAKAALGKETYVYEVQRNSAGTVLYINCGMPDRSRMAVIVTTTNVSMRPAYPNMTFNSIGEPHHWLDPVSKDWVFNSGIRYSRTNRFLTTSPDSEIVAIGERTKGIQCMAGSDPKALIAITNIFETALVGGNTNQLYVVGVSRSGSKASHHIVSCSRKSAGNYTQVETLVDWANNAFDLDGATGDVILGERAHFLPSTFEFNPNSGAKQKLDFNAEFVLFVNENLAQHLKTLNSKVIIQRRR